ncbi:cytokinin oxidase4b [Zea mays]|uniref:Cytokinin oxidase4b n=1 Tax=Zea mays TaxID=4577 RepID=A0A1D6GAF5_MAIZE|nr:cytokinin oxidase4b [Zea mays]
MAAAAGAFFDSVAMDATQRP